MNYKLKQNKGYLRWNNWKGFIKQIYTFTDSKAKYTILSINFNNADNIIKLINSNENGEIHFDLIIIDNSTKKEEKNKLLVFISNNNLNNITIIDTIENIGSAGAYALGFEYIFTQNYDYIILFEDDVLLLNEGTFSEMIKVSNNNSLVYINGPINTGCKYSWLVQTGLYSVEFLKKVGVPNPMYFTRSEDLELKERFDRLINKYGYNEIVVDKNYFHPYLKTNNGQSWWIYFSIRNHLYSNFKWFKFASAIYLITIFFYVWYGISKYIIENNYFVIYSVFLAIIDFIFGQYSFDNNKARLKKLKNFTLFYPKCKTIQLNIDEINKLTKYHYLLSEQLLSNVDRKKISYSKNISNFFKYGSLIGGFYSPLYPLFMLSKNIISINEYSYEDDKFEISIINNSPKYFQVILSLIISVFVFAILLPFIILKGIIIYISKYFG